MSPKSGKIARQILKPTKSSKPKPNGTRSTIPPSTPQTKQFKSAEFVVDSSDEDSNTRHSQEKTQVKGTDIPTTLKRDLATQPKRRAESESKRSKSSTGAATGLSAQDSIKKETNGMKPKGNASQSALYRPQDGKDTHKPTPSKTNSERRTTSTPQSSKALTSKESSGSEDESSSEEDESESVPTPKKTAGESQVDHGMASSESGTESKSGSKRESDNESGSDSDGSSSENIGERVGGSSDNIGDLPTPSRGGSAKHKENHTSVFRPTLAFDPPLGFKEVTDIYSSSEIDSLFQPSNLAGKQIWYITTPADVPISIDNVDLGKVAEAAPLISHEDKEYTLVNASTSSQSTSSIMLPNTQGYGVVRSRVTRVMHLQQIARLPSTPSTTNAQPVENTPDLEYRLVPKPKREQPKGLRMRYRPSGFGSDSPGTIGLGLSDDSDILYANESLASSFSHSIEESSKAKKRRERDGEEAQESATKKSKKHHSHQDGISPEKEKKKKKQKHTEINPVSPTAANPHTMAALQTSNPNGIASTSASPKDPLARNDDVSNETQEMKHHGHKAPKTDHSSESKASIRSGEAPSEHGGDGKKKKKKRRERSEG